MPQRYYQSLISLLPKGRLWQFSQDSNIGRILRGVSIEFNRLKEKTDEFLNESFPSTADVNLPDFEFDAGLPPPPAGIPIEERRQRVRSRIFEQEVNSFEYIISSLLTLGIVVTAVSKQKPLYVADFRAGDRSYSYEWLNAFLIDASATKTNNDTVGTVDEQNVRELLEDIIVAYATWGITYA